VKVLKVKARKVFEGSAVQPKGAYLSKSELLNNFCAATTLTRSEGKACFAALTSIGQNELQKRGKFVLPGNYDSKFKFYEKNETSNFA